MALTVRDIMDADPLTVEPSDDVGEKGDLHIRLVGVVTRVDVLEALARDQQ